MKLNTAQISYDFMDMEKLNMLAREAFPPEEYLSPKTLIEMSVDDKTFDFWALYDENKFIGFMVVKTYKEIAYLFFLAIDCQCRGRGYGSCALKKLKELYPDFCYVVDFEMLDDFALNMEQRKERRQFYLSNGYKETGQFLTYLGVSYEVMYVGNSFNADLFKELLSTLAIDGFKPVYFKNEKKDSDS